MGRSVDELAALFERLDGHPKLGLCLDSCHLWVSGTDVTDPDVVDETLGDVDRRIGLDRLRCLHVNDADSGLGSNRDRHANICKGEMGEGLGAFLAHPRVQGLPAILETARAEGRPRRSRGPAAQGPARPLGGLYAAWSLCSTTRKDGFPRGSSKNSGLTHPSSSARCS